MPTFKLNGKQVSVDVPGDTPLLWVLRDELDMTGTKYGCGVASCGACTVHLNGNPTRSCVLPVSAIENQDVITIESVEGKVAEAVQSAWLELDVVQCGYCQSGQIMSAVSLLEQNSKPSDDDIDTAMSGNACRCATYHRVRAAIHHAASNLESKNINSAKLEA